MGLVQTIEAPGRPAAFSATATVSLGFAAFSALQLWLVFTHAPWFDESQALLIARAPFAELVQNLKYEGAPALWYLWLGVIDRLAGASAWSLPLAQAPIALGILALIWFRSPFSVWVKLVLSLSYFFAFEYGVISRSYGLGALLLLAAVAARRSLWGWVFLALAANTAAHFTIGAVALACVLFMQRRSWAGAAILGAGCLLAVLTVYPVPADLHRTDEYPLGRLVSFGVALRDMSQALVPSVPSVPYEWIDKLPVIPAVLAGILVLPLGLVALGRSWPSAALAITWLGLLTLGTTTYELQTRHVGVLFVVFVAGLWMQAETGSRPNIAAWAWLAAEVVCGIDFAATQWMAPFSNMREVGAWIEQHGLGRETWGAWSSVIGVELTAQIGAPTFNVQKGCVNTFDRWNYDHRDFRRPYERMRASGARYVIFDGTPIPQQGAKVLATFPAGNGWGSAVVLYDFGVRSHGAWRRCA